MDTVSLWHEERGDGFPLVLVHGFTGSHRDWEGVVDDLEALLEELSIERLDLLGHSMAGVDTARTEGMATLYERIEGFLPEDQRARVRWANEHMDVAAFVELAQELSAYPSMLDQLATLALPTTVIVGEDDTGLAARRTTWSPRSPAAVFELIPDAAHSPQLENRVVWMRAVEAHLTRAEAT